MRMRGLPPSALLLVAAAAGAQPSCLDEAASVEAASVGEVEYGFDSPGHAVDASG
jgi:hypothetical protein